MAAVPAPLASAPLAPEPLAPAPLAKQQQRRRQAVLRAWLTAALVLLMATSVEPVEQAAEEPSVSEEFVSFIGQALVPVLKHNLDGVMELPFQTITYTEEAIALGLMDLTTPLYLRRLLYIQTTSLGLGDRDRTSIDMVYAGLENGLFLGYFSESVYTERAPSGLATDIDWQPYATLDSVNAAVAAGEARGATGRTVEASCPAAQRDTSSACKNGLDEAVAASDETACLQMSEAHTWYAPCSADCCDASIRNYYRTSKEAQGAAVEITRWRVYDHRVRGWYKAARNEGKSYSSMYEFATSQALGLTAMALARDSDGVLQGVLAIDYDVGALSDTLTRSLNGHPNSWAFALERSNGKLVAISPAERLYDRSAIVERGASFLDSRLSAVDSLQLSIAAAAVYLGGRNWPAGIYVRAGAGASSD